ncbi:glycosyltransferase family 2 protein [Patulibacter sp. SYSU D01012]|uniref:glycosyltransferase family 2 protein n=1 Tax=Patulibacter sp. SYSU D01012 TaxID=2817381 RepID=UPI001B30B370|nr:glycosyltransferase family 2 protein [Patulibacter sp. SYSU D01012]
MSAGPARRSRTRWWLRRAVVEATKVPSWSLRPASREPRRVRLLALLAVRDEGALLPGYLASVGPHVDGIVALDDGSTDGSAEILEAAPQVLEVLRVPPDRAAWEDVAAHRRLVAAGVRHGADWLVSLDADERVERDFRARAERVIRRGGRLGATAFAVRIRELWDDPHHVRVDGIWGAKTQARLFAARADHAFDERPFHGQKAPLQATVLGGRVPFADLLVYHLRMIEPAARAARRARYEELDPQALAQPGVGYAYLTDERGLRRRAVPRRRGFDDRPAAERAG